MTKPWKSKTNSSNILLVLITLMLVEVEWTKGENDEPWESNNLVEENGNQGSGVQVYVGNDEISRFFFRPSVNNNSLILENINTCLGNFQMFTCLKMLLLNRINNALSFLEEPNVINRDLDFLNGFLVFKINNNTNTSVPSEKSDFLSIDDEISFKVIKMFRNRSLLVNLFSKMKVEIAPSPAQKEGEFVCFSYKIYKELDPVDGDDGEFGQSRGRKKSKGGMSMMTMLPQLLMLGFMPFTLASLKAMVMNAVMINMMALNGAIFMTIRNLVFGPKSGDNVKYVNYGYSKDRQTQSRRPVLIIHSPAAFVKQPKVRKKPIYRHSAKPTDIHISESDLSGVGSTQLHYSQNSRPNHYRYNTIGHDDGNYYSTEVTGNGHHDQYQQKRRRQTFQKKNDYTKHNFDYIKKPNGTRWQSTGKLNYKHSNKKVNTYQSTTFKPEVRINPSNQRHKFNSRLETSLQAQVYLPVDMSRKTASTVPVYNYSEVKSEKPHFNGKETEFKASPQWDPMVEEKYFRLKSTSNLTNVS